MPHQHVPVGKMLYLHDNVPPAISSAPALPLFSIVTPSYNQGRFIRATIESVLTQDYPHIEYWVIDGGSTDETLSILKEYDHDQRFHWISEPDQGQSDAINKGLARCTGEIFSWLNSDDCLLPHALSHVVAAWLAARQPIMLYGFARLIDHAGMDLGYCPMQSRQITLDKLLWCDSMPIQPATFAPTEYVRKLGGVDVSLHYAMDLDLWIRLLEQMPIQHIPHDLALYRLHTNSKTVALSVKFIDDFANVLRKSIHRGLLTERQARSRIHVFAVRVYLVPEICDISAALANFRASLASEYAVFPKATFALLKGVARLIIGEKLWSKGRYTRARLS